MGRFEDFYWGYRAFQKEAYRTYKREFAPVYGKYSYNHDINISHYKIVVEQEWVDVFTEYFPYIENCIQELRTFLKKEDDLVNIELANKINIGDTLAFLQQHTDVILEYDEIENNVTPSKLINSFYENTYDIYENRFIYTLVNLCNDHIEAYFDIIDKQAGKTDVNCDSRQSQDNKWVSSKEVLQLGLTYFKRNRKDKTGVETDGLDQIMPLKDKINEFMSTELMRALRGTKFITAPLTMTNVLQKNPNFKKAVELWDFIYTYDTAPASVELVEEKFFDPERTSGAFFEMSNFNNFFLRLCVDKDFEAHLQRDAQRRQEEIERKLRLQAELELKKKMAEIKKAVDDQKAADAEYYGQIINDLNARLERYRTDTATPIDELIQKYSDLFEQLDQAKFAFANRLEKEYQQKFADKYKMNLAALADQKHLRQREMEKLTAEHEKRQANLVATMGKDHEKAVAAIYADHQMEIDRLIAEHQQQINDIVAKYESQLADTINAYEQRIEAQQNDYEKQIADLIEQSEKRIAALIAGYEKTIADLSRSYAKRLEDKVAKYEKRIAKLVADHKATVERLTNGYEKQIGKHGRQIAAFQYRQKCIVEAESGINSNCALIRVSDKFTNDVDQLNAQHAADIDKLVADYEEQLKKIAQKYSALQTASALQLQKTKTAHKRQMEAMAARNARQVELLTQKYNRMDQAKQQQIEKLRSQMQAIVVQKDKQYDLLATRTQIQLEKERQRNQARAAKDEQIRQQLTQTHQKQLVAQMQQAEQQRDQLVSQHQAELAAQAQQAEQQLQQALQQRDAQIAQLQAAHQAELQQAKEQQNKLAQQNKQLQAQLSGNAKAQQSAQNALVKAQAQLAQIAQSVLRGDALTPAQLKRLNVRCQTLAHKAHCQVATLCGQGGEQDMQAVRNAQLKAQLLIFIAQHNPVAEKATKAAFLQHASQVDELIAQLVADGQIVNTEHGFCINN